MRAYSFAVESQRCRLSAHRTGRRHIIPIPQESNTACGGDPRRLFIAGHSAGAQIAALLGTDPRYLARHADSTELGIKLRAAGVEARVLVVPGGSHSMPLTGLYDPKRSPAVLPAIMSSSAVSANRWPVPPPER